MNHSKEITDLISICLEYHTNLINDYDPTDDNVKVIIGFYSDILHFDFSQDTKQMFNNLCQLKKDNLLKCNSIYQQIKNQSVNKYAYVYDNILGHFLFDFAEKIQDHNI